MIKRFYVHNFRCLENFELPISDLSSVLLVGRNGSGKSSVGFALEILQRIARGVNRVGELVEPKDFSRGRVDVPMRFEITVELGGRTYDYVIAFEYPDSFKELRVLEEKLIVDGEPLFSREVAQVKIFKLEQDSGAKFLIDWHMVALSIVQERSPNDPLFLFKQWLARMLILRPVPSLITGDSKEETLLPEIGVSNYGAWFAGLMSFAPSAYSKIDQYLKEIMPDFKDIKNPIIGKDFRSLTVQFANDNGTMSVPFADLSDGEKCFMICGLTLAANDTYGPIFCYWDEPDNYLALSEVGHFVLALRKQFHTNIGSQLIVTSHNPEAIRRFSDENTLILSRRNHLEPTMIRRWDSGNHSSDIVSVLIRGDDEP